MLIFLALIIYLNNKNGMQTEDSSDFHRTKSYQHVGNILKKTYE